LCYATRSTERSACGTRSPDSNRSDADSSILTSIRHPLQIQEEPMNARVLKTMMVPVVLAAALVLVAATLI
jgi:hypothetical protein